MHAGSNPASASKSQVLAATKRIPYEGEVKNWAVFLVWQDYGVMRPIMIEPCCSGVSSGVNQNNGVCSITVNALGCDPSRCPFESGHTPQFLLASTVQEVVVYM